MNQQKLLQDVASLPLPAQEELIDFIAFLKERYHVQRPLPTKNLLSIDQEPFIGMWENRADMNDSSAWVNNLRRKEWG